MNTPRIILIVAMTPQRIIGKPKGGLPWPRISEDFKHFKKETIGHPMVVGNTTFMEFPNPLPGRFHSVVSRTSQKHEDENVFYSTSPGEALIRAQNKSSNGKIFVIGGATIYDAMLGLADEILVTRIQIDLKDGPIFPQFEDIFHLHSSRNQTEEHELKYVFERWVRNESELEHNLCTP